MYQLVERIFLHCNCHICVLGHHKLFSHFVGCTNVINNALIKSSLLYGSETWRLTENNKRWVEATEMDALRRSSRISRKERIRNIS